MAVSFLRTIIIFALLLASVRVMGKRQLGELEPLELTVAVLISNLASQPLSDIGIPLVYGVVPVLTLLSIQVMISWFSVKSARFRVLLSGKPSILIENGVIKESEMRRNRISLDELNVELRRNGATDLGTVERAVLETDGTLTVVLREEDAPLTPSLLGIRIKDRGTPTAVITDGRTLTDNLSLLGLDERWLRKTLTAHKIRSPECVYLMTVDRAGTIYLQEKEAAP